jgi:hypothetical protein
VKYKDLMNWKGYLDFAGLTEPEANALRIWVHRCKESEIRETISIGDMVIRDTYPIEVDGELPLLQIDFPSYVSYSVINESFTVLDDYERYVGDQFRIYTKSRYLDFILAGTIAAEVFPEKPIVHYEIACLDHIIDVVSFDEPIISEVERKSLKIGK